jgi:hypothetical protein
MARGELPQSALAASATWSPRFRRTAVTNAFPEHFYRMSRVREGVLMIIVKLPDGIIVKSPDDSCGRMAATVSPNKDLRDTACG